MNLELRAPVRTSARRPSDVFNFLNNDRLSRRQITPSYVYTCVDRPPGELVNPTKRREQDVKGMESNTS